MPVHQFNHGTVNETVNRGLAAYGSKVDNSMCDCPSCEGRGGTGYLKCKNCKGTGQVENKKNSDICPTCHKKKVTGPYAQTKDNCNCGK